MKRFIICILLALSLFGCTEKKDFDVFEISYNSGWAVSFSFKLYDDGHFNYQRHMYELSESGQVNPELLDKLRHNINILKESKIKSHTEDCFDCTIVSVWMKSGKDTLRIFQKGNIDKRFWPLIDELKILTLQKREAPGKPIDYKTEKDIAPPPPPPPPQFKIINE